MGRKNGLIYVLVTALLAGTLSACGTADNNSAEGVSSQEETSFQREEFVPEVVGVYEAEDAAFSGNVKAASSKTGFSGSGYATGFEKDDDTCSFTVEVAETGFYDLKFLTSSSGYKENYVKVDGEQLGTIKTEDSSFAPSVMTRVYLTAGSHSVSVNKYWGYIELDNLTVQTSEPIDYAYHIDATLCNPNATDEAKRLMSYLADNYGTNILSGQYSPDGMYGKEYTVINKVTGKYPAVLGLDFIEYSPSRVENGSSSKATDFAIQYWNNGGIVTFCWHWNAPSKYLTGQWYSGFYKEHTNIDLAKIMNGEDQEGYELLMNDIDAIAQQLLILQEAKVPVLWRPLHEAAGGWFWWGASGAEAYKKLYVLMYEKLTNEYGLNNLIWLWNGQDKEWYPGDEYVDIIGEDLYPGEHVYTSQVNKYLDAVNYTPNTKMVVMSENGCVFDPALAVRDGAMWGFWCTWCSEFVAKNTAIYAYSEQYTEKDKLKEFYDHSAVITLDEIPDLTTYPIRKELQ